MEIKNKTNKQLFFKAYELRLEVLKQEMNSSLKYGDWVISTAVNTYYQFNKIEGDSVLLMRKGCQYTYSINDVFENFRIASKDEVKSHIDYMKRNNIPYYNTEKLVGYKLKACVFDSAKTLIKEKLGLDVNPSSVFEPNHKVVELLKQPSITMWFDKVYDIEMEPETFKRDECEFYMVTCRGQKGTKYRHTSYDEALAEAQRIANLENHPTWVVGVVAKISPNK